MCVVKRQKYVRLQSLVFLFFPRFGFPYFHDLLLLLPGTSLRRGAEISTSRFPDDVSPSLVPRALESRVGGSSAEKWRGGRGSSRPSRTRWRGACRRRGRGRGPRACRRRRGPGASRPGRAPTGAGGGAAA